MTRKSSRGRLQEVFIECWYALTRFFRLHWSANEWQSAEDNPSSAPVLGFHFVDVPISAPQQAPIRFTFFWTADNRWEGRDYLVTVE